MGDQDSQSLPVIDYASMDNSIMPDANKYVPDQENALPQHSPAVEYAADAVVLPDGTSRPSAALEAGDASALSGEVEGIAHQDSVTKQGPQPPAFVMEDTTAFSEGNKVVTGQDTPMEQVTQSSVYEEHHADGNGSIATVENKEPEQTQYEEPLVAISTEEERLWGIVRANSADFTAWTSLIQETEKTAEDHLPKICKVYDAFLAEFPLCYGYWKKYADHEARLGSAEKILEVYERAVQAVTYSVDIWMHYAMFAMATYEDPEIIRRLFERGLSYVGTDYLSYPLWDKYIEYEYSQQEWSRLAQIYTRILQIPIQQLDRYFSSFKELAASRPLLELRTAEENAAAAEAASMLAGREGGEKIGDGEEGAKPESVSLSEADELEKYIGVREAMYKIAKEMDAKIRDFENAIRRPYFHVKPLDDAQLSNWHHYLDFIEKTNDFDRMVKLFERCLIACANYPEYWIRYVQCMQAAGSMEVANDALVRSTQIFVKRQPEIHIFAARFKEQLGDTVGARAEYQLLNTEIAPGLLDGVIKHANMEHRLGNLEAASSVFDMAIAAEKSKEHSQSLHLLFIQYSRYLQIVEGNAERAKEVLTEAFQLLPYSKPLMEVAIHLESIKSGSKQVEFLDSLVEQMLAPKPDGSYELTAADREEISSIFLEFVDLFGDINAITKAEYRHRQLFLPHKNTGESKKRPAQDSLTSDKSKVAKSYAAVPAAVSPAQSGAAAYPNGQAQWGAGYAQQSQSWQQPPAQQAPQAQPQQWMPGYGQQAGYAPYAGYANYGPPQQPTNPAQQPSYAGYGQGYPTQAFPQQNYGQPAPAYTPPQQQAAAPQYYPGYY
ncbi:hypothetical protein SUGI_1122340 [Cryptomeria japonica]|uniref:pre-mRNA-processing factor 39-1 isoform X2 n=1 Tax=Cryptomeria japonica TaxID=3369 RepID=UPI002414C9E4|nr:pre-mRNA-processing factor 39-1 isoform X2 [Cryptomeria japonica]GLJ52711.1 hypothetical protein SUGI_1122340 [Cryptomeria japonica]